MKKESLNILAWQKLKRNKLSFFSLCFIVLIILIGLFAVIISPDHSKYANEMHIELATKRPLFNILFLEDDPEVAYLICPIHILGCSSFPTVITFGNTSCVKP